jgi:hypothetical protein
LNYWLTPSSIVRQRSQSVPSPRRPRTQLVARGCLGPSPPRHLSCTCFLSPFLVKNSRSRCPVQRRPAPANTTKAQEDHPSRTFAAPSLADAATLSPLSMNITRGCILFCFIYLLSHPQEKSLHELDRENLEPIDPRIELERAQAATTQGFVYSSSWLGMSPSPPAYCRERTRVSKNLERRDTGKKRDAQVWT